MSHANFRGKRPRDKQGTVASDL